MGKYAAKTMVSSDRSKAEIEKTLRRYGADQFISGWKEAQAMIQFRIKNKMVRFTLPLPNQEDFRFKIDGRCSEKREVSQDIMMKDWEQACRQRWRALCLSIKAKLESVECEIGSFEKEFLAYIVIPGKNGQTIGEVMVPQIEDAYANGKAPRLGWEG